MLCGAAVLGGSIISVTPVGGAEEPFTRVRPYNLSSHLPEFFFFFTQLLGGRVWVFERRGALAAVYLAKNGDVLGCWLRAGQLELRAFQRRNEVGNWQPEQPVEFRGQLADGRGAALLPHGGDLRWKERSISWGAI